jgi:hypothetical protein
MARMSFSPLSALIPPSPQKMGFSGAKTNGMDLLACMNEPITAPKTPYQYGITSICVSRPHPPHHHFCYRASCSWLVDSRHAPTDGKIGSSHFVTCTPHPLTMLASFLEWHGARPTRSEVIRGEQPKGPKALDLLASSGEQYISVSPRS